MLTGNEIKVMKSNNVISRTDNLQGGQETVITAQITLPVDGGWGWIVVFCSFFNIFILDGVAYTFGAMIRDVAQDLQKDTSVVALLNSIAVAMYFLSSPIASALINRFGFRECAMSGSMICAFALLISYFLTTFSSLCLIYGGMAGFGYCLINMSSGLVVGFYFEKFRFLAISISTCGSSLGVMILYPLNNYLVRVGGWRNTVLLHSGLFGLIFFLSMSFRPLLSLAVKRDESVITTVYLPSLMKTPSIPPALETGSVLIPTKTERLFKAVSNANYPTAAAVVDHGTRTDEAGPSKGNASRITLCSIKNDMDITTAQLKQVQSLLSRSSKTTVQSTFINPNVMISIPVKRVEKKRKWWRRLFSWEPHTEYARPMYRDDAFFEGDVKDTDVYKKNVLESAESVKTGLEYQMAVSRAVAKEDLQDRKRVFTTSTRRVLATMMDPVLLKRPSFLLMCLSGLLTYLGFLVPYVYLQERDIEAGLDPNQCRLLISVIGFSNAVGRFTLGTLASKIHPLIIFAISLTIAGISTIISGISYNINYQYLYCMVFGFCIASVACLRSLIIVRIYGLDKLTNATGMMLIFLGIGNLVSTPVAGIIKRYFGYTVAFYVAGTFIMLSGLVTIPIKCLSKIEDRKIKK